MYPSPSSHHNNNNNNKNIFSSKDKDLLLTLGILFILLGIIFITFLLSKRQMDNLDKSKDTLSYIEKQQDQDKEENTSQTINNDNTEEIDTSDWLTYRSEEYGFEFRYPAGWGELKEYQEAQRIKDVIIKGVMFSSFTDPSHYPFAIGPEEITVNIEIFENILQNDIQNFISWYDTQFPYLQIIHNDRSITKFGDFNAIRETKISTGQYETIESDIIYIQKNKKNIITISFSNTNIKKAEKNYKEFIIAFLKSFKILM